MTSETHSDLAEEREFLLKSLEDLDAERAAGELSDADYSALRDDYTARAAAVLRALQRDDIVVVPEDPVRSTRRVRVVLACAVVALVTVAAAWVLSSAASERLPGDTATGSIEATTGDRLNRAGLLLSDGKATEALRLYDEVLAEDPRNAEALAYRGWIMHLAGLSGDALPYLDRAVAAAPTYPDAHFFRGMVLWQAKGDPVGAVAEFELFLANNPPEELVPAVEEALARARAEAGK